MKTSLTIDEIKDLAEYIEKNTDEIGGYDPYDEHNPQYKIDVTFLTVIIAEWNGGFMHAE